MSFYYCTLTTLVHLVLLLGPMVGWEDLKKESYSCQFQGAFLQFLVSSSVCWFFWIGVQLYTVVVLEQSNYYKRGFFWAHFISWGFPTITTILDLAIPGMHYIELWCWVRFDCYNGLFEWIFYLPVMLILVAVACQWIISVFKVFQHVKVVSTKSFIIQNIIGVFIIFISYSLQAAHRLYILERTTTYLFEVIHIVSLGSQGSLCFFVYGTTMQNLQAIRSKFKQFQEIVNQEGDTEYGIYSN